MKTDKKTNKLTKISRRYFLKSNALLGASFLFGGKIISASQPSADSLVLAPGQTIGNLWQRQTESPLENAKCCTAQSIGDGLSYTFDKGTLANFKYLTADILLDGRELAVFLISLQAGDNGDIFSLRFGLINQCSARIRFPLDLVDMNRWRIDREGAWLKPTCSGSRIDLTEVDRMTFKVVRKSEKPIRWYMTDITAQKQAPPKIQNPILPKGKLLDEMGQYTLSDWKGKTKSVKQLKETIEKQYADIKSRQWPEDFSKWGGWKKLKFESTGFFHKKYHNNRWWLVDPAGCAFWSTGIDCVRSGINTNIEGIENALTFKPDPAGQFAQIYNRNNTSINYLAANFIRTFGSNNWRNHWAQIAISQLKRIAANTVGNWSDWQYASKAQFPYVRPLSFKARKIKNIFRDFPDVFDPEFANEATQYASALKDTADDPALIGYFMMNEPTWGFNAVLPAEGMLYITPSCRTRTAFGEFLKKRYSSEQTLADKWQMPITFETIKTGRWTLPINKNARTDLEDFSEIMVERYFSTLSQACRKADPHHLNLGIRYQSVPPLWAVKGMKLFDVFSMNSYTKKIPADKIKKVYQILNMPVIIGEWHFGALDVGLPASGIGRVKNQTDRGKAYRIYIEDAAANPYCVGTHWFTFYDQSALGRFDGENYNIGFFDICNKPYEPLCKAAKISHRNIYKIATGQKPPFSDPPQYLNLLFL